MSVENTTIPVSYAQYFTSVKEAIVEGTKKIAVTIANSSTEFGCTVAKVAKVAFSKLLNLLKVCSPLIVLGALSAICYRHSDQLKKIFADTVKYIQDRVLLSGRKIEQVTTPTTDKA